MNVKENLELAIKNMDKDSLENVIELLDKFKEVFLLGNISTNEKGGNDSYKRGVVETVERIKISLKYKEVL